MKAKKLAAVIFVPFAFSLTACRSGTVQRLTDGSDKMDLQPSVSPDARQIVFCRFKVLTLLDLPGGRTRELKVEGLSNFSSPVWSPDGKKLAFSANHATRYHEGPTGIHIIILDLDSNKWECVTPDANFNTAPCWSPDGEKIAFTKAVRNGNKICIYDLAAKKTRELVVGSARSASWSPDGKTIAFVAGAPSRDIYLIDADGSDQRLLVGNDETDDEEPTWTPDGKFVVFTRQIRITEAPESRDLWAVRVADKTEFQLTRCPKGFWAMAPSCTPDGKAIVFALRRRDHAVLRMMSVNWENPIPQDVR